MILGKFEIVSSTDFEADPLAGVCLKVCGGGLLWGGI
jgi:hypothetical protein